MPPPSPPHQQRERGRRPFIETFSDNATFDSAGRGHEVLRGLRWWWPANGGEARAAADGSWVEVMRRQWDREARPLQAAWFFLAPGSGIWLNTGKSVRLDTWHQEDITADHAKLEAAWRRAFGLSTSQAAARHKAWRHKEGLFSKRERRGNGNWFNEVIVPMAREQGFETIQIRRALSDHNDSMIVHLASRPSASVCGDGIELRAGFRATRPCACLSAKTLNCDGG